MKLKNLQIDAYNHLENLNFDFTYPDGHENAGKPLDKICIVGQSATGKTNILELIKNNFSKLNSIRVFNEKYRLEQFNLDFKGSIEYAHENFSLFINDEKIIRNGTAISYLNDGGGAVEKLVNERLRLIYFGSDLISKDAVNIFNQSPIDILSDKNLPDQIKLDTPNFIYEFQQSIKPEIWFSLLSKILGYRKRFTQMASELINKGAIGDLNRLNKEFTKWSNANENPLVPFAKYFNPVLKKLNLEIDLVNTEYPIPIKSKINDEVVPISSLSTGTKGLLLSMFPLFELDTDDSIILIDEPERSLFPDMQIELMANYSAIAPNAQFIVATHSPFIAAAFEPEERFILYFDNLGKVNVRKGKSPIGDDPNDMLSNDFNVDYYNEFGKKAYENYLELKTKLSSENQPEKKKKLLLELVQIGNKYNF